MTGSPALRLALSTLLLSSCATVRARPDESGRGSAGESTLELPPWARSPSSAPASSAEEKAPLAPAELRPQDPRTIPGGLPCLIRLKELGIDFVSLPPLQGVATPVQIKGPISGISYRPLGRRGALVCDCRLALALHRAGPYLLNLGVTEMGFSRAYAYSLMPSGRLSQHAMGLAIDIHRVTVQAETLEVKNDFALGLPDGCAQDVPTLNRMACLLRAWGLFDWVLTPDFDRAHYNHFHLDIYDAKRRPPPGGPIDPIED